MSTGGLVVRVEPENFARLMREEASISATVLDTFVARRAFLRIGKGARSGEVLGSRWPPASLALRSWLARLQIPRLCVDVDAPDGLVLATASGARSEDLPCVVTSAGVLQHATTTTLAYDLGLRYHRPDGRIRNVVIIGGGPAGLGAARVTCSGAVRAR